jgi:hypothetical protein
MEFREKPHTDKYKGITKDSNYVASCKSTSHPDWDLFVAQSVHFHLSRCHSSGQERNERWKEVRNEGRRKESGNMHGMKEGEERP